MNIQMRIDDYEDRRTLASIFLAAGYKISQKIEKKGTMSYTYYLVVEDPDGNIKNADEKQA